MSCVCGIIHLDMQDDRKRKIRFLSYFFIFFLITTKRYLFSPRSLDQLRIDDFSPAVLALYVRPVFKVRRNSLPYLTVSFDNRLELLILREKKIKS